MSTYAIGDVQGCDATLGALLSRVRFDPTLDRLWFVGDLVNRGPASLAVLRRVMALGSRATVVLGNHDLHLLACAAGARPGAKDTFDAVLAAPDRDALIEWLRHRPVAVYEAGRLLIHAGLLPGWRLPEVLSRADAVHGALRGSGWARFVRDYRAGERLAPMFETLACLTRVRMIGADGTPEGRYAGPPEGAPSGLAPWYERSALVDAGDAEVVFGHWAALGHRRLRGAVSLDSGCIWGQHLTAFRLEDSAAFVEPMRDPV